MNRLSMTALAAAVLLAGCDFEDTSPSEVSFSMTGGEGSEVQIVLSTEFVAGVTEEGVTEVELIVSDTVTRTLPVDTVVSVVVNQRFFVEVLPLDADQLDVRVRVDVDDRSLLDKNGVVLKDPPFRYVYLFNQRFTDVVDVVF